MPRGQPAAGEGELGQLLLCLPCLLLPRSPSLTGCSGGGLGAGAPVLGGGSWGSLSPHPHPHCNSVQVNSSAKSGLLGRELGNQDQLPEHSHILRSLPPATRMWAFPSSVLQADSSGHNLPPKLPREPVTHSALPTPTSGHTYQSLQQPYGNPSPQAKDRGVGCGTLILLSLEMFCPVNKQE